ncbi:MULTISPECIES: efflux RND transporter periplasmic adaptor subunit [Paenibacillus]|uniref:efflux RND transporter periplasmic adaptor subunit n=1 Tax=Paenibacillus TaxID=44249 RepID=UPI0022B8A3FC|nr:efflux RND transporter periplasmic adaptor subunit [Paenibacillus caseinilyticus]MCZ8518055.1 efflux RND transporter periplasmic adaptor subunit [Paenibacillus caseinilyticus]
MSKKKWLTGAAVFAVLAVTGILYTQSRPSNHSPKSSAPAAPAIEFQVTKEDIVSTVEVKGKSSYQKETYVNAPFGAEVKTWAVKEGAQVAKGDLLFRLDDTALRNEIIELQAGAKKQEMENQLARFRKSAAGTQEAPAGVTEAEAKQRFADAENLRVQEEIGSMTLEHTRTQLAEKSAKLASAAYAAPEDGIFLFDGTKEPESVKEHERIGKIVDLTKLQLICMVSEYDLFRIQEGLPAEVRVDALKDVKLQGKVEKLSKFAKTPESGSGSGTTVNAAAPFEVILSLEPHERLIAGLSLTATIETGRKSAVLAVPTLAIQRDKDGSYVMVRSAQGAAERRTVKTGLETPDKTEILEGVAEGETIVL